MSISVPNTLAELQLMSKKLGIFNQIKGSKKDGSKSKEDYIIPIRNKMLEITYNGNIPVYLSLMLDNIKSPMLAKRIDELKEDAQKEIWNSEEWYFEEKINGIRCFLVKHGSCLKVYSREISKLDLLPIQIPLILNTEGLSLIQDNFILDCELTSDNINTLNILNGYGLYSNSVTQSMEELLLKLNPILTRRILKDNDFRFKFNVLDCLYINGWIMNETLEKRKIQCAQVVKRLSTSGIRCRMVSSTNQNKKWFYSTCITSGLEGCVCKRADSIYIPDTTRRKDGWIKIKSNKESASIKSDDNIQLCDTVDGFISGFNVGKDYIDSLEVSAYVDGVPQVVCWVEDLDPFLQDYVTKKVQGVVTIKPDILNSVVELDSTLSSIQRFRFDKSYKECNIQSSLLNTIKMYKESLL